MGLARSLALLATIFGRDGATGWRDAASTTGESLSEVRDGDSVVLPKRAKMLGESLRRLKAGRRDDPRREWKAREGYGAWDATSASSLIVVRVEAISDCFRIGTEDKDSCCGWAKFKGKLGLRCRMFDIAC